MLKATLYIALSGAKETAMEFGLTGHNNIENVLEGCIEEHSSKQLKKTALKALRDYYEESVPDRSVSMTDFYINVMGDKDLVRDVFEKKMNGKYIYEFAFRGDSSFRYARSYCNFLKGEIDNDIPILENATVIEDVTDNADNVEDFIALLESKPSDGVVTKNGDRVVFKYFKCGDDRRQTFIRQDADAECLKGDYFEKRVFPFSVQDEIKNYLEKINDKLSDKKSPRIEANALCNFIDSIDTCRVKKMITAEQKNGKKVKLVGVEIRNGMIHVYGIYEDSSGEPMLFRSVVRNRGNRFGFRVGRGGSACVNKLTLYGMFVAE
jgi:hypothetical protein